MLRLNFLLQSAACRSGMAKIAHHLIAAPAAYIQAAGAFGGTRMFGKQKGPFVKRHALSLASVALLLLWIVMYSISDDSTHWGSFFGNAIADWSGVVVTILATKHLYERGSRESKQPRERLSNPVLEALHEHSLTIFLLITGSIWVVLFMRSDPQSKWGQVVGNIVSEWTQILGLVLLTKKLIEIGSKEDEEDSGNSKEATRHGFH
jgi:peptidoglycan/LPS O-acetylase OafA/YrhL